MTRIFGMALVQAKAALRKELKQKLAAMTVEERTQQSIVISQKLLLMPEYQNSRRVCLVVLQHAVQSNRECFIPQYKSGLDLFLMPVLGFTRTGDRIGRGKVYYDSYLQKCYDKGFRPKTIALAYKEQICDEIPVTESDIKVDLVLCPD